MTEIWRDIKDYEGLYQVSNFGRIRSFITNRILKQGNISCGYLAVVLCKNGKKKMYSVHRLVASTFIPNPENKPQVNHKNENKQDNRVENLEWMTAKDNINHGTHNKRVKEKQLNDIKKSKIVLQYTKTGEFIREWVSVSEIERQLGYFIQNISDCCLGKNKTSHGFIWKYK